MFFLKLEHMWVKGPSCTITLAFCLASFYAMSTTNLNLLSICPKPTVLLFTYYRFQRLWASTVCSSAVLQASSSVDLGNSDVPGEGFENACCC